MHAVDEAEGGDAEKVAVLLEGLFAIVHVSLPPSAGSRTWRQ